MVHAEVVDLDDYVVADRVERDAIYAAGRARIRQSVEELTSASASPLVHLPGFTSRAYDLLSRMAYPQEFERTIIELRQQRRHAVLNCITWLEEDHFCRWSGYTKQRIMRYLRHCDLTDDDRERLRRVVIDCIGRGRRAEFRDLARLARYVDAPHFRDELFEMATEPTIDEEVRERAMWALEKCTNPAGRPKRRRGDGSRPSQPTPPQP